MVTPIDPASVAFLIAENRSMPMHVGGLQLFRRPEGAGRNYGQEMYHHWRDVDELAPLFLKHPFRSLATAGQWVWAEDDLFDIDHHVRHSALPKPGRVRELLDLCSRLHGTRLAYERPLWEAHVIEGLRDGRLAVYTKMHHALVDGVSSMRLLQSVLSADPDRRDMPPPWGSRPRSASAERARDGASTAPGPLSADALTAYTSLLGSTLGLLSEAAGLPGALTRTLGRSVRRESSPVSFHAPRTILNGPITGARRFAAEDWPMARLRAVAKASGTTINDVVLAMCAGALRTYLLDLDGLPQESLVSMVPVSLHAAGQGPDMRGGNAVGTIMVQLSTDVDDAGLRLERISHSVKQGRDAMATMSPLQVQAMSAIGVAPVLLNPVLKATGYGRPPFNLIISNVPGPRTRQYLNGAEMVGMYPLSIPFHGNALNITCTSYAGNMAFGLTGCRRSVPHLQRMLTHLDVELRSLERSTGL